MSTFSLDSKNSEIEFHLNSVDSHLHIDTITTITFGDLGNEWINILPKLELNVELKHLIFDDSNISIPDTRSFCIPITIDPIQSHPVFKINRTIENKILTIGINPEKNATQH